jgi:hypothetical protein
MSAMRNEVIPPPADLSEADGRVGLSALVSGRRRRPALLIAATAIGFCTLAALRQTAPGDSTEATTPAPQPNQSLPVRLTPSPTSPPRGSLPKPDVSDAGRNRLIGNVAQNSPEPGEQAAFVSVNQILNWYCPESMSLDSSMEPIDGWRTVKVIARPRPGTEFELFLRWSGSTYRWQGPKDALDDCW